MITIADAVGLKSHESKDNPHGIIMPEIPTVPRFATPQEVDYGTSKDTVLAPADLKRREQMIRGDFPTDHAFASNAQIDAGVSNTTMVHPAGLERHGNALIAALTKDDVDLGNVRNMGRASSAEARAGTTNEKVMTPFLVKAAIEALSEPGGDTWTYDGRAGGDYGWIRHNPTGLTLEWGQSHALYVDQTAQLRFPKTFASRPFAIVGSTHTFTGDTSISQNNDSNECVISVISKSISYSSFQVVCSRFSGKNTDGGVFSWLAIGRTNLNATDFPEARRSRTLPTTNYSGNLGIPTTSNGHLVAPRSDT